MAQKVGIFCSPDLHPWKLTSWTQKVLIFIYCRWFLLLKNRPSSGSSRLFSGVFSIKKCKGCLGGGFKYFVSSPLFGEDFHFDSYFSKGLKPPTSCGITSTHVRCRHTTGHVKVNFPHGRCMQGSTGQSLVILGGSFDLEKKTTLPKSNIVPQNGPVPKRKGNMWYYMWWHNHWDGCGTFFLRNVNLEWNIPLISEGLWTPFFRSNLSGRLI